jgi:hypothetical protein
LGGYFTFTFYLFFTWIFFGEGGDSLLYTKSNEIVWAISPAIGAAILNGYRVSQGLKMQNKEKVQTYIIIQLLFFLAYVIFTILKFSHHGYHI